MARVAELERDDTMERWGKNIKESFRKMQQTVLGETGFVQKYSAEELKQILIVDRQQT